MAKKDGVSFERKQAVLLHMYRKRKNSPNTRISSNTKKWNVPILIDDTEAAEKLVKEKVLGYPPRLLEYSSESNGQVSCFMATLKFLDALKKYGIADAVKAGVGA